MRSVLDAVESWAGAIAATLLLVQDGAISIGLPLSSENTARNHTRSTTLTTTSKVLPRGLSPNPGNPGNPKLFDRASKPPLYRTAHHLRFNHSYSYLQFVRRVARNIDRRFRSRTASFLYFINFSFFLSTGVQSHSRTPISLCIADFVHQLLRRLFFVLFWQNA